MRNLLSVSPTQQMAAETLSSLARQTKSTEKAATPTSIPQTHPYHNLLTMLYNEKSAKRNLLVQTQQIASALVQLPVTTVKNVSNVQAATPKQTVVDMSPLLISQPASHSALLEQLAKQATPTHEVVASQTESALQQAINQQQQNPLLSQVVTNQKSVLRDVLDNGTYTVLTTTANLVDPVTSQPSLIEVAANQTALFEHLNRQGAEFDPQPTEATTGAKTPTTMFSGQGILEQAVSQSALFVEDSAPSTFMGHPSSHEASPYNMLTNPEAPLMGSANENKSPTPLIPGASLPTYEESMKHLEAGKIQDQLSDTPLVSLLSIL
jgi:hypothetical protein